MPPDSAIASSSCSYGSLPGMPITNVLMPASAQSLYGLDAGPLVDARQVGVRILLRGRAAVHVAPAIEPVSRQPLDVRDALSGLARQVFVAVRRAVGDQDDEGLTRQLGQRVDRREQGRGRGRASVHVGDR